MEALVCKAWGPPEELTIEQVDLGAPTGDEVVVDVAYASVNFPDFLIVQGMYQFKPPFPFTPGSEISGRVTHVGPDCKTAKVGDRVIALCGNGGMAEQVKVAESSLIAVPDDTPLDKASCIPMIYGTSWYALKQRGQLKAGETLLVTGAAGGVGWAAAELGKEVGARVIAAVGSDEKAQAILNAGLTDTVINYGTESLKERMKELTGGLGADVVYDPVGGDLFDQCMRSVGWNGRVLVIGFTAGIPKVPTNLALLKGASVVGVFWGSFTTREPEENAQNYQEIFTMLNQGKLNPPINKVFPLAQAAQALRHLGDRKALGKVVVEINNSL